MQVLTFGFVPQHVGIVILAAWECIIGLGLLMGVAMRLTLGLLFLQMLGTLTPLALFHGELFSSRYFAPALEGPYIIKNLVLIGGALVLGGTVRGGFDRERSNKVRSGNLPPCSACSGAWQSLARCSNSV